MAEADVVEDGAEIAAGVVVNHHEAKRAVKAAVKAAALQRANRAVVNHVLAQHRVYVNVLDARNLAVIVVNVLAKLVKANQNQDPNLDPNQDPNLNQEQIKS